MTNPFLAGNNAQAVQAPAVQTPVQQAPVQQTPAVQAPVQQTYQAPGAAAIGEVPSAASGDPFSTPTGGGDGAKIGDDVGQALLLRPSEYIPSMNTTQGVTDAVRADWIVLTGPNQGQVRTGSLIFQKVLKTELRNILGTPKPLMPAVLIRGEAKNGNSAPYLFAPTDEPTKVLAAQAAQAHNWI